jgi:cell division protein FtsW (lipid II flippase)
MICRPRTRPSGSGYQVEQSIAVGSGDCGAAKLKPTVLSLPVPQTDFISPYSEEHGFVGASGSAVILHCADAFDPERKQRPTALARLW